MHEYHDESTKASDPLQLGISDAKLIKLHPELYHQASAIFRLPWGKRILDAEQAKRMLSEHMSFGDSRAAVVVQMQPLLVAVYTDEQDCVLILKFPEFLAEEYQLISGSRLLTVNTYGKGPTLAPDIVEGPAASHRWTNFYPVIVEFVSDNVQLIHQRKLSISDAEWSRAFSLANASIARGKFYVRDGRPLFSRRFGTMLSL